ncbi:hypothetical protein BD413DRAFT_275867 [Trametes elegans]|nr:hypothetical protein BD413DRAFT_275867 [Trametes elegans]
MTRRARQAVRRDPVRTSESLSVYPANHCSVERLASASGDCTRPKKHTHSANRCTGGACTTYHISSRSYVKLRGAGKARSAHESHRQYNSSSSSCGQTDGRSTTF